VVGNLPPLQLRSEPRGEASNPTDVQILARGTNTSLKLVNKDGRERVIQPE